MASQATTVLSARFEDLVDRGLRGLIDDEPALRLVAHGVPHQRLDAALTRHAPDVAILNFGSLQHVTEVAQLHESFPATRLIVLANRPTAADCNQMLALGATGCLAKEVEARDVLTAIHLASRGLHVLPRRRAHDDDGDGPAPLTRRETEVLGLLQLGYSNAHIAQDLHVGTETVRSHARAIYRKLGVRNRRELTSRFGAMRV